MAVHALALVAIAALAAAGAGGVIAHNDLEEFELDLKVVDALTEEPVVGALVEIKDANGTIVASGLTDEDGEYEISVDDEGTDDSDEDEDEAPEMEEIEDEASLGSVVGPLTVTVSKAGYTTQTFTVNLDTWDDEDLELKLVPTAA